MFSKRKRVLSSILIFIVGVLIIGMKLPAFDRENTGKNETIIYKFDFGLNGENDIAEGYTGVTPDTIYSTETGFGLLEEDTVVSGGKTDTDILKGDYLQTSEDSEEITYSDYAPTSARFTFLVDLPNGDYEITANYRGSIFVNADQDKLKELLIGEKIVSHSSYTELKEETFRAAVVDGQLDLNFDCAVDRYAGFVKSSTGRLYPAAVASIKIEKLESREEGDKPTLYIMGDSTAKSRGKGWGDVAEYYTYNKMYVQNHAMAGRSFLSYFREGRMVPVLTNVKPGDLVTVGFGINWKGDNLATDKALLNHIAEGVIQRGAIPIFLTPTPGGYSSNSDKSYYDETTKILRKRNNKTGILAGEFALEKGYIFIDVDQLGNDYFMSIPEEDRTEVIKSMYTDHNHFSVKGAEAIAKLILDQILESGLF